MDTLQAGTLAIRKNLRDIFANSEDAKEIAIRSDISGLNQFTVY